MLNHFHTEEKMQVKAENEQTRPLTMLEKKMEKLEETIQYSFVDFKLRQVQQKIMS